MPVYLVLNTKHHDAIHHINTVCQRTLCRLGSSADHCKKNENQKLGQKSTSDIHHVNGSVGKTKRMSIKNNRGDNGDGTKNDTKQNK